MTVVTVANKIMPQCEKKNNETRDTGFKTYFIKYLEFCIISSQIYCTNKWSANRVSNLLKMYVFFIFMKFAIISR